MLSRTITRPPVNVPVGQTYGRSSGSGCPVRCFPRAFTSLGVALGSPAVLPGGGSFGRVSSCLALTVHLPLTGKANRRYAHDRPACAVIDMRLPAALSCPRRPEG